MKKKALVAAVLAATTLSATTAFAASNPFNDVPADHWSYDALEMLAKDGVLEGYGDGTFRGDQLMNRYEMAEVVAKAAEKYGTADLKDKGVINKLEREYKAELNDMEVRLTAVESDVADMKKGMSSFKWWGDARMRVFENKKGMNISGAKNGATEDINKYHTKDQAEMRIRLGFAGNPAPNLSVTGQLKAENENISREDYDSSHYAGKNDEKMSFNRLQLDWYAKNGFTASAGRNELCLGQGLLYWENPVDGIMVKKEFGDKASLLLGAGDTSAATWDNSAGYATFANLSAKVSPAVTLTAAYFNQNSDAVNYHEGFAEWNNNGKYYYKANKKDDHLYSTKRDFQQLALGVNAQLSNKWNLIAEGVHNNVDFNHVTTYKDNTVTHYANKPNANKNGFWSRLTYGHQIWSKANTWQAFGEYFSFGGLAVDSSGWPHRLNIAGGNGYGGQGARGWGLGFDYMLANNTNLELTWYKLKPYDSNNAGFSDYKDTAYASLTYSF